jgi:lysophospholipase L1-like esterase
MALATALATPIAWVQHYDIPLPFFVLLWPRPWFDERFRHARRKCRQATIPTAMKHKIALLLGSLAVASIILEVIVRLFHIAPAIIPIEITRPYGIFVKSDNPLLRYVPKPNSGDINQYGLRDYAYPIHKPQSVFRIIVIGDSIGFGYCNESSTLKIDDTFPKVLERDLSKRSLGHYRRVEVINLSVSGYDTEQEVEFLRTKGLALQPDLVIVAYCLNDAWDASIELGMMRQRSAGLDYWRKELFLKSELVRLVSYRLSLLARHLGLRTAKTTTDKSRNDQDDRVGRAFGTLAQLSQQYRFKTLIAVFPFFERWSDYPESKMHKEVGRKARKRHFFHLDLLHAFQESSPLDCRQLQGRCNREHPDEAGHRVAASAIGEFILENNLVD